MRFFDTKATINDGKYNIDDLLSAGTIQILSAEEVDPFTGVLPSAGDMSTKVKNTWKVSRTRTVEACVDCLNRNLGTMVSRAIGQEVNMADIVDPIDIVFTKGGTFEFIFQLVIRIKGHAELLLVTIHMPRDSVANGILLEDCNNQVYFREQVKPDYIPANYGAYTGTSEDGTTMNIYVNEWLTGFRELHVAKGVNGDRFVIFGQTEEGTQYTPIADTKTHHQIALEIYKQLTIYNELHVTSVSINSGDSVIKVNSDGTLEVRLITTRSRDELPRISYDKRADRVIVRKPSEYLAYLLSLKATSPNAIYNTETAAWRAPAPEKGGWEMRIAGFETALEGFHMGVRERLLADGCPENRVQAYADDAVINILQVFQEKLAKGDISKSNPYVAEHKDDINKAIATYLDKVMQKGTADTHAAEKAALKAI